MLGLWRKKDATFASCHTKHAFKMLQILELMFHMDIIYFDNNYTGDS